MKRAAVVIGVDKTGSLPKLNDAAAGAQRFAKWAQSQGMSPVKLITDQRTKVTLQKIKDAVGEIVEKGVTDQLVIYFAGHGVNLRYSEYWLLSDAPKDTQAAVNVAGSSLLARYCGIPHVVFISDACRTASEGIQAQFVTGGEIFPNDGAGGLEQPVDQFFACTLGRPAHEVKDPTITSKEYKALYTSVLLDSLQGTPETVVDWVDATTGYVRPRKLKQHLYDEVTEEITRLGLQTKVIQVPDARITSDTDSWLAQLDKSTIKPKRRTRGKRTKLAIPPNPADLSQQLLGSVLVGGGSGGVDDADLFPLPAVAPSFDPSAGVVPTADVLSTAAPFGPMHHETQCGFKIRGARFTSAFSTRAQVEAADQAGEDLRVGLPDRSTASVLLSLDTGASVVLPAIAGFLCGLTIEEGELVDVAYEPSDNSPRWHEFEQRAQEVRKLRAIASSSTRDGVFRLEQADALSLARQMQYAKGVDPALALYAAYAYQDLQQNDLIKTMCSFMYEDIGAVFFDLALLAGDLRNRQTGDDPSIMGFMPLLSQGWAQLSVYNVSLPPALEGMARYLLNSPWTMFNQEGSALIRNAIGQGVVL